MNPGTYKIVLARPNTAKNTIDLPSEIADENSGKLHKMNPNTYRGQQWIFSRDPDRPDRWKIKSNLGQDQYMEIDGDDDPGAKLRFGPARNSAYQAWRLNHIDGDRYIILNDGSGLCIDWKTDAEKELQQYTSYGNEWQIWSIQPVA